MLFSARICGAYISCTGTKRLVLFLVKAFLSIVPFSVRPYFPVVYFFFFLVQLFVFTDGLKIMRDDSWFQLTFIHIDATID